MATAPAVAMARKCSKLVPRCAWGSLLRHDLICYITWTRGLLIPVEVVWISLHCISVVVVGVLGLVDTQGSWFHSALLCSWDRSARPARCILLIDSRDLADGRSYSSPLFGTGLHEESSVVYLPVARLAGAIKQGQLGLPPGVPSLFSLTSERSACNK